MMAMNNIIPRFPSNENKMQTGGVVKKKQKPTYSISPSTSSSDFSAATQMSRLNGMYDMKSSPVVVSAPQQQSQTPVTGMTTTSGGAPVLASSPRALVANDYMFRNALSQAING